MDAAIDHEDQDASGAHPHLSAWLWKSWYAKLWWATIPAWWVGLAVSTRVDTLESFYRGWIAGYLNVLFFPMTTLMVLGVGYVRARLDSFVGQGDGVPLSDACGRDDFQGAGLHDDPHPQRIEKLAAAASRHRKALGPLDALAALGGFEIAMMAGAMLQAASERRVVLVDGFVSGAAALVARSLSPHVADYLVHAQRSADSAHRLMLIHLQAHPLLDLGLRINQGTGTLLAWPLLLAAQSLLET